MSEVDLLKEKIAYLKLWLSIMVVTDISMFGWLLGNYTAAKERGKGKGVKRERKGKGVRERGQA